ncbi:MAG: sulfatase-like hydrolase/transferase [Planctomycetaceae bacterium]|nr:sulfatase-like hydrolase/transferase [Planctomycetaceae bacterium]
MKKDNARRRGDGQVIRHFCDAFAFLVDHPEKSSPRNRTPLWISTAGRPMKTVIRILILFLLMPLTSDAASEALKPNIVVFLADDMGWGDSATYGHKLIKTPNLDRLASQGVKFTQCYSACAVCSPSRSSILTGRTPYRNGVYRHLSGNHEAHLRASEITYPKLLRSSGYETCHVGKWHLNSKPQFNTREFPQPGDHGYDYWMATHNNAAPSHRNPNNFVRNGKPVGELNGFSAPLVADEAVRWLNELRDDSRPFALSIWFHEPHSPIATDPKFSDLYDGHENSRYMGNITQLDHALGMVMKALDEEGVSDNTLLIFTSDNGPVAKFGGTAGGLRGGKRSEHEGGIRVPGVVRWPGHIRPGTVSDVPVIGTDIFATVLDVAGLPLPKDRTIDGVSMLPAFEGKAVRRRIPLFWRTHVSPPADRVALRMGDWKLVGDETLTTFQLYEIQKDWKEERDLASLMPEKTEEMKRRLFEVWNDIESEGPDHWWKNERQKPAGGGKVNY